MEYHNPTLRVLRILELIDANSGGLSLTEIANLLDLPKGTISPILKTLAATNYVVTDGSLYKIVPMPLNWGCPTPAARTLCPLSAVKCAASSPK